MLANLRICGIPEGTHAGIHHLLQRDRRQHPAVGTRVVQELVDDGVELCHIGGHVRQRFWVCHAHLGLQAQPGQGRAQVMRNTGQHQGAVLVELGELLRHAVKADVDIADLAGVHRLVEPAGHEVAFAHPARRKGQGLERAVDQARDQGRAGQRQASGHDQPNDPGGATARAKALQVGAKPIGVAVHLKADPQPPAVVHLLGHHGRSAQALAQLLRHVLRQSVAVFGEKAVAAFARNNAQAFFLGHGLEQRHAGNGVGVDQGGAAEVDLRRNLARRQHGPWLEFEGTQGLQPGQNTAQQQQRQHEKSAPKKTQFAPSQALVGRLFVWRLVRVLKLRQRGLAHTTSSGTKT